jgi:hypothetical protein
MDGGGGNTTTVQNSEAPEYAQPYIKYGLGEAQNLYNSSLPSYYPGSTLAAQSPTTQAGIGALANRGMAGSPLVAGAQAQQAGTIGGQHLASNPMQDAVYGNVSSKVLPSVNSQFSGAGRYGSNAHQNQLVDQLTNAYAPYASQNYQFERSNQEAASRAAPGLAGADYQDIQAVLGAGQMQDQYGQQQVNADIARHDFAQNIPAQKLAQYMAMINGGTVGGTVTSQQPNQNNTLGQLGGLLLGGAGLGMQGGLF